MPFANLINMPSSVVTVSGGFGGGAGSIVFPLSFAVPFDINQLAVDINITAVSGTTPSITFFVDRIGADGNWYQLAPAAFPAQTAVGTLSVSLGPGDTGAAMTQQIRFRWVVSGTGPSFTFSASIIGH
jgi:hypothetical protein